MGSAGGKKYSCPMGKFNLGSLSQRVLNQRFHRIINEPCTPTDLSCGVFHKHIIPLLWSLWASLEEVAEGCYGAIFHHKPQDILSERGEGEGRGEEREREEKKRRSGGRRQGEEGGKDKGEGRIKGREGRREGRKEGGREG